MILATFRIFERNYGTLSRYLEEVERADNFLASG